MSKKLVMIGSLLFILVGLALGAYFLDNEVKTIPAKRGPIVEAVYGLGKVKTDDRFEVKLGIMSTVQKVYVNEGEKVQKGSPLIRFSDSEIFRSPITGTVTLVEAHENETVLPQATVLRVENLKNVYIEVSIEQEGAIRVRPEQKAHVLFESVRDEQYNGKVKTVFPRSEEFLAHIDVPGLPENILPGMTADVAIEVAKHEDALLVPLSSIQSNQVTILKDGKKRVIPIKIGGIDGSWAEVITDQIHQGDPVIIPSTQENSEKEAKKSRDLRFGPH